MEAYEKDVKTNMMMMMILIWQSNIANLKNKEYITSENHKDNFPYKVACRLINSLKPDIQKIDKNILNRITKVSFR